MPAHVLVINPNTRAALTAQLLAQLSAQLSAQRQARGLGQGVPLIGATASFGADYIASESSYVVAAHAVLAAWERHLIEHGRPLAVLVACFGDPGVWALRETAGVPVMGLAEAAMREADALGPFAIVTGGTAWEAMLERLARGMQLGGPAHLRHVRAVPLSGGELMADPGRGARLLGQACADVLEGDAAWLAGRHGGMGGLATQPHAGPGRRLSGSGIEARIGPEARSAMPLAGIILGGAALGGWCDRLTPSPTLPLIDSVAAGGRWLRPWA